MGILTGGLIGNWISNAWNGILLTIDYVIYMIINVCYQLFEVVSKVEVFSTDKVSLIANRIYTILGIVMLFVFAYNIILGIIDPDSISKGDKSMKSIAQNTVISIVLVTLFPLICEYLQTFQNHIIENGTIGNLILGSTVSETSGDIGKKTAYQIPVTIFTAFYHPINENKEPVTLMECENGADVDICDRYSELARNAKNSTGDLWKFMQDGDLLDGIYDEEMEYLFPLSTIAGALAAYLFLSFSLDLGVRAAKLGALKLIAPIPIFLRITKPKGGQFDKWFSDFTKTYLQVFERIMVIYFAVLIISFVPDIDWTAGGGSWFVNVIASVVIILGILKFAKDAPKMLEELFSIKIPEMSIKKKLNDNEYAKRAVGLGGAAVGALSKPFINNGKEIIKGFQKDPTDGRRHWIRGFGRAAGGTLRDLPGTMPGVFNSARRGWQNGNVSDWREMGDAVGNARAQNQADMNTIKNKFTNGIESINNAAQNPKAWLENKGKEIGSRLDEFANGPELSNEKLAAAKAMTDKFNFLFNKFKDKSTEDAMNAALKDYNGGKSVRFRTSFTGTDGKTYNAGDAVPVSALSADLIKKHFEGLQREALLDNFNKKQNSEGLKMQTKIISEQMVKTLNTLGEDAQREVLKDHNKHSISVGDLEAIIQRASEQRMTADDMADLRTVAKAMEAQYKSQDFGVASEKQKDKK